MQDPDPTSKDTEVGNRDGLALPKGNTTSRWREAFSNTHPHPHKVPCQMLLVFSLLYSGENRDSQT